MQRYKSYLLSGRSKRHLSSDEPEEPSTSKDVSVSNKENVYDWIDENIDTDGPQLRSKKIKIIDMVTVKPNYGELTDTGEENTDEDSDDTLKDKNFDVENFDSDSEEDDEDKEEDSDEENEEILEELNSDNDTLKDKDFDVGNFDSDSEEDDGDEEEDSDKENQEILEELHATRAPKMSLSEQLKAKADHRKKKTMCKFCGADIQSMNFVRHLQRKHLDEKEVKNIMQFPKKSTERKNALSLVRNQANFDLYINGIMRPKRQERDKQQIIDSTYYPCVYCQGVYKKAYLARHAQNCLARPNEPQPSTSREYHLSKSHTAIACASDPTNTISRLNVKNEVFALMKGDKTGLVAKKDLLIAHFGNSYLKKHKRERLTLCCSNKMRELARLLQCYRQVINNDDVTMKELIHPKNFDLVVTSVRHISGYDPLSKNFTKSASLAMHMGTTLKTLSDELTHLILKEARGFKCNHENEKKNWLENVKNFKKLVTSRWNIEIGSIANKNLQEKRIQKPLLIPLVSDVKIFREKCLLFAEDCVKIFESKKDDQDTYKLLVKCTLALSIVFNRRRIGDIQYLKIKEYAHDNQNSNLKDFESALTESERRLAKKYKRVVNTGKGSNAVVILFPENMQDFIKVILKYRTKYLPIENEYIFAIPGSTIPWGQGDVAIRELAKKIKLKNTEAFTSNKLRKHIAIVMQLLNLKADEMKQFTSFMGHTQKTHDEFYELPVDIYQTAKVSKILMMMEQDTLPVEYKGKSLCDIDIDIEVGTEEPLEHEIEDTVAGTLAPEQPSHEPCIGVSNSPLEIDEPADKPEAEEDVIISRRSSTEEEDSGSKKKAPKRHGWDHQELSQLKEAFGKFISKREYPSGDLIKEFIKNKGSKRTTVVIKSKIQHLINLSIKNKTKKPR